MLCSVDWLNGFENSMKASAVSTRNKCISTTLVKQWMLLMNEMQQDVKMKFMSTSLVETAEAFTLFSKTVRQSTPQIFEKAEQLAKRLYVLKWPVLSNSGFGEFRINRLEYLRHVGHDRLVGDPVTRTYSSPVVFNVKSFPCAMSTMILQESKMIRTCCCGSPCCGRPTAASRSGKGTR